MKVPTKKSLQDCARYGQKVPEEISVLSSLAPMTSYPLVQYLQMIQSALAEF